MKTCRPWPRRSSTPRSAATNARTSSNGARIERGTLGEGVSALRARALRLLARRDHSRLELARKLAPANPDEVERLLDELQARGWLSDQRVADQRLRAAAGRFGSRRVVRELTERGVAREIVAQARRQAAETELTSARAARLKRFGKPPANLRERARQARFLEQRGFDPEVIRRVVGGDFEV